MRNLEKIIKMDIVKHLFSSRGIRNTFSRAMVVSRRFDITSGKIEAKLNTYIDITEKFDCRPTFPITAITLERHPALVRNLSQRGVEFAIHGYIHTNYTELSLEEQTRHLEKAIDIFSTCQIPFKGFRSPYLKWNDNLLRAVGEFRFLYDSSQVMLWDIIDKNEYQNQGWKAYKTLLNFYKPKKAEEYLVLPRFTSNFIEIPVSVPDDESLIDRLGITDKKKIAKIWLKILQETYKRGELFTAQLHHERISFCRSALETVLQQARELNPPVWITTLGEIGKWWKEKNKFTFEVTSQGNGKYTINAKCSERTTILVRNCKVDKPTSDWTNEYRSINNKDFTIESHTRPFIGVKPGSSKDAIRFLHTEGFVVEESDQPDNYGVYFDNLVDFQEINEKSICQRIELSKAPLLRFWRWPNKAKSALAITGDIDSVTLIDFFLRLFGR